MIYGVSFVGQYQVKVSNLTDMNLNLDLSSIISTEMFVSYFHSKQMCTQFPTFDSFWILERDKVEDCAEMTIQ